MSYRRCEIHEVEELFEYVEHDREFSLRKERTDRRLMILKKEAKIKFPKRHSSVNVFTMVWRIQKLIPSNFPPKVLPVKNYLVVFDEVSNDESDVRCYEGVLHVATSLVQN